MASMRSDLCLETYLRPLSRCKYPAVPYTEMYSPAIERKDVDTCLRGGHIHIS